MAVLTDAAKGTAAETTLSKTPRPPGAADDALADLAWLLDARKESLNR